MMSLLMSLEGCICSQNRITGRAGVAERVGEMFTLNMIFDNYKRNLLVGAYLTSVGTSFNFSDKLLKIFRFGNKS